MMKRQKPGLRVTLLCLPLCLILVAAGLQAETPALWGDMEPGSYAVGFKTLEQYDYSRAFQSGLDYFGAPRLGETARPIQICIWYPAVADDAAVGMVYSEYAYPFPENTEFDDLLGRMQGRELQVLFSILNNDRALVQDAMDLKLMAVRDATPAEKSFPLLVYHGGFHSSYFQNVVLCEYLASHGFVVVTTHAIGTVLPNPTATAADIESAARDKEFAVAQLRDLTWVDHSRIGTFGFHLGGITALAHQMRNMAVSAVATLQGAFLFEGDRGLITGSPSFDIERMSVPWLQIYSNVGDSADLALVDQMKHSERYTVSFAGMDPLEFSTYAAVSELLQPDTTTSEGAVKNANGIICRYVLNFFKGQFYNDEAALASVGNPLAGSEVPSGLITTAHQAAEALPPTAGQFVYIARNYDAAKITEVCEQLDLDSPEQPILGGQDFTNLGYEFLQGGDVAKALVIFRMGTEAYPTSANAWDSYGEACLTSGDNASALKYYQKALEILPSDSTINPALRDAIANNAPAVIERLQQTLSEQSQGD